MNPSQGNTPMNLRQGNTTMNLSQGNIPMIPSQGIMNLSRGNTPINPSQGNTPVNPSLARETRAASPLAAAFQAAAHDGGGGQFSSLVYMAVTCASPEFPCYS